MVTIELVLCAIPYKEGYVSVIVCERCGQFRGNRLLVVLIIGRVVILIIGIGRIGGLFD